MQIGGVYKRKGAVLLDYTSSANSLPANGRSLWRPRGNCHNCQLLVKKRVLGDSATELIEFPSQRGLSVNRAVLERVPSYFESRADAVGATAPIFSATTLAAS